MFTLVSILLTCCSLKLYADPRPVSIERCLGLALRFTQLVEFDQIPGHILAMMRQNELALSGMVYSHLLPCIVDVKLCALVMRRFTAIEMNTSSSLYFISRSGTYPCTDLLVDGLYFGLDLALLRELPVEFCSALEILIEFGLVLVPELHLLQEVLEPLPKLLA